MITRPSLRIGVEEEYQIIDPQTRNLEYVITRSSKGEEPVLRGHDSEAPLNETLADLTRSLASPTLGTVAEVRDALLEQRIAVCRTAEELGLVVAAAGAHPFASWRQAGVPMPNRFVGLHDELSGVGNRGALINWQTIGGSDSAFCLADSVTKTNCSIHGVLRP